MKLVPTESPPLYNPWSEVGGALFIVLLSKETELNHLYIPKKKKKKVLNYKLLVYKTESLYFKTLVGKSS